jgi:hypothetical protein
MIPLTVNDEVAGVLGGYVDSVEIRDEHGRILGHFIPYLTPHVRDVYEHPEKYFDLEKSRNRPPVDVSKCRPLSEVIRELEEKGRQG